MTMARACQAARPVDSECGAVLTFDRVGALRFNCADSASLFRISQRALFDVLDSMAL